ncbi:MAG TPA: hypothetical protein EYP10_02900 [Armatimonadetes bacterium]|nr:hypothetical protein [Armatimonadota bacterium]
MAKYLLIVTNDGYGKRTPLTEFRPRKRAAKGVSGIAIEGESNVIAAVPVSERGEAIITTANGRVLRLALSEIRVASRSARGSRLIALEEGDSVVSVAVTT